MDLQVGLLLQLKCTPCQGYKSESERKRTPVADGQGNRKQGNWKVDENRMQDPERQPWIRQERREPMSKKNHEKLESAHARKPLPAALENPDLVNRDLFKRDLTIANDPYPSLSKAGQKKKNRLDPKISQTSMRILVICSSGLSSTMFADLLQTYANRQGLSWQVSMALPMEALHTLKTIPVDLVLLAPQMASFKARLERDLARKTGTPAHTQMHTQLHTHTYAHPVTPMHPDSHLQAGTAIHRPEGVVAFAEQAAVPSPSILVIPARLYARLDMPRLFAWLSSRL